MRVVIDTNVYISFLLGKSRQSSAVNTVFAGIRGDFTIICSELLITEIRRNVSGKPYLTAKIPPAELEQLITALQSEAIVIDDDTFVPPIYTRDPKDDYLVALALAERADFLVSGDRDLLELGEAFEGVRIVSPARFAALLDQLD